MWRRDIGRSPYSLSTGLLRLLLHGISSHVPALEFSIVTEAYKLAASPILFTEGQFKGKLKGIAFSATSPSDTRQWLTINCGQFLRFFKNLIPDGSAEAMVAALVRGDNIDFPGLYREEQFECGFTCVHNGTPVA